MGIMRRGLCSGIGDPLPLGAHCWSAEFVFLKLSSEGGEGWGSGPPSPSPIFTPSLGRNLLCVQSIGGRLGTGRSGGQDKKGVGRDPFRPEPRRPRNDVFAGPHGRCREDERVPSFNASAFGAPRPVPGACQLGFVQRAHPRPAADCTRVYMSRAEQEVWHTRRRGRRGPRRPSATDGLRCRSCALRSSRGCEEAQPRASAPRAPTPCLFTSRRASPHVGPQARSSTSLCWAVRLRVHLWAGFMSCWRNRDPLCPHSTSHLPGGGGGGGGGGNVPTLICESPRTRSRPPTPSDSPPNGPRYSFEPRAGRSLRPLRRLKTHAALGCLGQRRGVVGGSDRPTGE